MRHDASILTLAVPFLLIESAQPTPLVLLAHHHYLITHKGSDMSLLYLVVIQIGMLLL